ncbi:CoA transferase [Nocardia sp. NPDC052112]|uniref:CoA transferase n=1 Tax=Nocardia sp. NPDC052112 TaxID=3155646 RepID=UPI0034428019
MYETDFVNAQCPASGPMRGVRVVDLSTSLGSYVGRLYADLGAEVIRPEPIGGHPDRQIGAAVLPRYSAEWIFHNVGKRSIEIADLASGLRSPTLTNLLASAQVLITSESPANLRSAGLDPHDIAARFPSLTHINVSPYGLNGPWADRPADDLALLAAGGLLGLAGDPDRAPVRPVGRQSAVAASLHAAIGGLIALLADEDSGHGQLVDVSAQEAVTHSLENAIQYYDLEGEIRSRAGSNPKEAGTGLFACRDGYIYVVGGLGGRPLGWDGLIEWLDEAGVTEARILAENRWRDRLWRRTPEAINEFRRLLEQLTTPRTKRELYEDGQRHGVSVAPVSMPEDLLENPQLQARHYFREVEVEGHRVRIPGAPYRFAELSVGPGESVAESGHDTERFAITGATVRPTSSGWTAG